MLVQRNIAYVYYLCYAAQKEMLVNPTENIFTG